MSNQPQQETTAASKLVGLKLNDKWNVIEEVNSESTTGGFFSCTYLVEENGRKAFLKAIDMESFFLQYDGDMMLALQKMTDAHNYERELLKLCKNRRLRKVAMILDDGQIKVDGHTIPVPFLIFELAQGDARSHLGTTLREISIVWKLKSLHGIASGLRQLNSIDVSHQDIKPSNILVFDESTSKVGDLGRSFCKDLIIAPHDDGRLYSGHTSYAPPEVYYRYYQADWERRNFSIDNYQLGSMIVYYFSFNTMTALLFDNLPEEFQYYIWEGSYPEIQPYIIEAFYRSLEQFGKEIEDEILRKELVSMVEELCHPNPELRGHPKNHFESATNNYCLRRYETRLDVLYRKAKYNLIKE